MPDDIFTRLGKLATEVLNGQPTEVRASGEDYYVFTVTNAQGVQSSLPAIWIAPGATDTQIRAKLADEFQQALYPDAEPGDLSVPNLQTEGKIR